MSVYKKLMDARMRLQSIKLKKSGKNKFAVYEYFELGDFLPTVQKIFSDIGLCSFISFSKDYATLVIKDIDDGGEIVITSPMAEANLKGTHPIQNLGAVETYNRRYLWMAAMEIVEHDALDSAPPVEKQVQKIAPNQNARDDVPKDELPYLEELAAEITQMVVNQPATAKQRIRDENLEEPQMRALWSYLDAPTRRLLKATP